MPQVVQVIAGEHCDQVLARSGSKPSAPINSSFHVASLSLLPVLVLNEKLSDEESFAAAKLQMLKKSCSAFRSGFE